MTLKTVENTVVHFPDDKDKFAFDKEVASIFPDMAVRSIPNFLAAHSAHARMVSRWMHPGTSVLDVGASRGHFLRAMKNEYPDLWADDTFKIQALDNSPDMCGYLRTEFPGVEVSCLDLTDSDFLNKTQAKYDIVCVNYVLQFIHPSMQISVLLKLISMVKPGGVFILGHKSKHSGYLGSAAEKEYIDFRVANGYTRKEIEAKTQALKGSMFPMDHESVMSTLKMHFVEVCETFRFMMFSTVIALR